MYYVGLKDMEDLDIVLMPAYNDEIKEHLEYFYNYKKIKFVISGEMMYIAPLYLESLEQKLKEWEDGLEWLRLNEDEKSEYNNHLDFLKKIIYS